MSKTVADLQAQISENRTAIQECHEACTDLEDAWLVAEKEDQRALAQDPNADADAQEKVEAQLRRTRARRAGLESHAEALKVQLHQATAEAIRATMVPLIEERRDVNEELDVAVSHLVASLRRHIELSDELSSKYAGSEREANGHTRPVFDASRYRSADLLAAWLMGHLNTVPGFVIEPARSVGPASLEDLDSQV